MKYNCELCNDYITDNIYSYIGHIDQHIKENNKLSIKSDINTLKKTPGSCDVCQKEMSNYYIYQRHLQTSCVYSKLLETISTISDKSKLAMIMDKCESQIGKYNQSIISGNIQNCDNVNIITGNNNEINNNKNNITINLNNLKNENLDMIDSGEFAQKLLNTLGTFNESPVKILRKFEFEAIKNTFTYLFEEIYFNEKFPQNHNIYINSQVYYRPFHIYVDDRWCREGNLETIKDIIVRLKEIFMEWITDVITNNCKETDDLNEIKELQEYLEILKEDLNIFVQNIDNDKQLRSAKKLVKHFFDIAYNNRGVVENTFKETKKTSSLLKNKYIRHKENKRIRIPYHSK